ncbi:hypothetical protein B0H12DRAFT_1243496 [Mycena haematopus]|nr:hypothetical protein B0H12DRAFT_1243496 [Mycena haematopus]
MAVTRSTPRALAKFSRPRVIRPVRAVRLTHCNALDRWLATTKLELDPMAIFKPTPDDQIDCEIFVCVTEGFLGAAYTLTFEAFDQNVGSSGLIHLARFTGSPGDPDAPLWTRRLPLGQVLDFQQSRAFVARLVGGMTEIPVRLIGSCPPESAAGMLRWARDTAIGTSAHALLARRYKSHTLCSIKSWVRGNNLRALIL